ncbi:MAG: LuxR C-terminal-related transcriptional regulator [Sandaracinaceae bacterium]|nr:LuxR C-terminal-related transcriptional regulator [Sandaracinaceae bacterium]
MSPTADLVLLVEQAYASAPSEDSWLDGVHAAAAPLLEAGFGLFVCLRSVEGVEVRCADHPAVRVVSDLFQQQIRAEYDAVFRGTSFTTLLSQLERLGPEAVRAWNTIAAPHGIADSVGVMADDLEGSVLFVTAPFGSAGVVARHDARAWQRAAAHLGAAHRLRRRLGDAEGEAVLTPGGRVLHASGAAREPQARAGLARAARAMDRARTRVERRTQPLEGWTPMTLGRWSLVEREERGARLVHAMPNLPSRARWFQLTPRERCLAELARLGFGNKQIAYAMGLSTGTVGWTLASARRKLGLRRRVQLAEREGALAVADVERELETDLSAAELEVAMLALSGASNVEIARARDVSVNTVANQLRSVFARTGTSSRAELAALVSRRAALRAR